MVIPVTDTLDAIPKVMTEEEFEHWCDEDTRAEFKDGEIIMASPVSQTHLRVFKFLLKLLDEYATRKSLGEAFGSEFQVRLRAGLRRVPDLFFVSQSRLSLMRDTFFDGAPDLIIEIVSSDSIARDWRDKFWEYEQAGVREYAVIDPQAQHMEWYALNAEQRYELIKPKQGVVYSRVLEGFYVRAEWLWEDKLPDPIVLVREMGVTV